MPPTKIALRLNNKCCGVIVAATFSELARTKSTASSVVTCSTTTRNEGKYLIISAKLDSTKTFSRSKISQSLSVTSPWINNGISTFSMASKIG